MATQSRRHATPADFIWVTLAMSTEPDKSADDVCKRIESGNYDLAISKEPDNSAHEVAELPSLVTSDEDLLKFVDGMAGALREWRDNPSRRKELCTEKLQIRAEVFDAMIEQARSSLPEECGGVLAGHGNLVIARFPLRNKSFYPTDHFERDEENLVQAYRDICKRKLSVIAHYHSHPNGCAYPSEGDIQWNPYANLPHVIIGISPTEPAVVKAYCLYDPFEELPCERTPN
jgi:proteasome lid subunit RPN8/RPN11